MSTLEIIQNILVEKFSLDRAILTPDVTLDQLGIDSLTVLEMLFDIEDRFGLKINDDTPRTLHTLQDVVAYVDSLLLKRKAQGVVATPSPSE
jgi:acyl carrier protein